jgi:hypothetical protein
MTNGEFGATVANLLVVCGSNYYSTLENSVRSQYTDPGQNQAPNYPNRRFVFLAEKTTQTIFEEKISANAGAHMDMDQI